MEYLTRIGPYCVCPMSVHQRNYRHHLFSRCIAAIICLLIVSNVCCVQIENAPGEGNLVNQVSIEDFIDLDDWVPSNALVNHKDHEEHNMVLGKGLLHDSGPAIVAAVPAADVAADVDDDDEDDALMGSGSGSGSGDLQSSHVDLHEGDTIAVLTPTKGFTISGSKPKPEEIDISLKDGYGADLPKNKAIQRTNMKSLRNIEPTGRRSREGHVDDFDEDAIYDLRRSSNFQSNDIINPANWMTWSQWQTMGSSAKVRVRTCQVEGRDVSDCTCKGISVQMRSCKDADSDECGPVEDVRTDLIDSLCQREPDQETVKVAISEPIHQSATPPADPPAQKTDPKCEYSLYDTHRKKYVFTQWNLTQVMSQSKLKKWCERTSGQYIVMTTPTRTCRRMYKDLCQAARKCRSSKPARERGDFAEGCWRGLVYGDMLPVGLSNKQTIVYFICQRFAADSAIGRPFGYKETHFGTLYDTQLRTPVLSLHKMSQLGDETWPDTNYFIEHGLVEEPKDMLWLFRRPRKGMLTLSDLDRCYDDQACEVGLRQVLPADYDLLHQSRYTPTPLVWPEWMGPTPAPRIATFTLTNTAPMLTSLFDEWQTKVRDVRRYAIQQCGVPYDATPNRNQVGQMSARRYNKAALYMTSGVIPTQNPSKSIGRDVNVPYLFWMAGCCVRQHPATNVTSNSNQNSNKFSSQSIVFSNLNDESNMVTNITAFSMYVQNTEGNHVIVAPVLQLELLLQDMYKVKPSDPEVTLFPGQESACSELQNDVSRWFL